MRPIEKEILEFSILKELSYNDNIPTSKDYNIDEKFYVSLFKDMVNKLYLNPNRVLFNILGYVQIENELDLVTNRGNEFIQAHEGWNKIYNSLNDFKKLWDKEVRND